MAGWKLRKDKAAETPGAEDGAAAPTELREETNSHTDPALPAFEAGSFEAGSETNFSDLDFDGDDEPKAHLPETGREAEQGDGPLTLVDYTEPEAEYSPFGSASHRAQVFDMPPAIEMAPIEMAPPAFEEMPAMEALPPVTDPFMAEPISPLPPVIPTVEDDFQQRLRTGRFEAGELAPPPSGGFANAGIPSVSPFVLDTPPVPLPPAAPQLVVHVGRLSAPFDVTKDVTTIGRPDSALHYYPDVEIELDDAVSRRHAEVVKRGDGYYLVDTGSTNGTRLNGTLLPAHEEHLLAHGDRIRVGEITEIVFE